MTVVVVNWWLWEQVEGWHLQLWHLQLWSLHLWHKVVLLGVVVVRNERLSELLASSFKLLVSSFQLLEEIINLLLNFLDEVVEIWEHELKKANVLVHVFIVGFLDLGVEGLRLDVGSLNGLVPLKVEATDGGSDLTEVIEESVDFGHLLKVGVAGVVGVDELANVEDLTCDLEHVVEDAALHVLHEDALCWVLNAPVFEVV